MIVTTFKPGQQYEVSKAMTVARIAMSTTLMPVTVNTFETRRRHIGPTVTPVTGRQLSGVKNDDSYEDGDRHFRSIRGEGWGRDTIWGGVGTRSAGIYRA